MILNQEIHVHELQLRFIQKLKIQSLSTHPLPDEKQTFIELHSKQRSSILLNNWSRWRQQQQENIEQLHKIQVPVNLKIQKWFEKTLKSLFQAEILTVAAQLKVLACVQGVNNVNPQQCEVFRKMPQCCFAVKLQRCFVNRKKPYIIT